MNLQIIFLLIFGWFGMITPNEEIEVKPEFKKYFDACKTNGSIVVFDEIYQKWIVSDTTTIFQETLPASSFKIINTLIALETKTIKDENEVVKWVGKTDTVKYGYRPEIYHDMTVKEAFEVSAGWVYVELAKKIGKNKYLEYLKKCQYGNLKIYNADADFWNFGSFGISPKNQVDFIRKVYAEKLPFSKRNIRILKNMMITERGTDYTIRAKTGWTREAGVNTGWWVGYVEKNNEVYFFATRLLQDRRNNQPNFGSCRKEITKSVLKDLGVLK